MSTVTTLQVKLWMGELYIANKMLEEEVEALRIENKELTEEVKGFKDAGNSEEE
jgi:hypothetical protein